MCAEGVSSPATSLTLIAPTNTGMNASLTAVGSRPAAVARSPTLTLHILEYHLLPTPIPVSFSLCLLRSPKTAVHWLVQLLSLRFEHKCLAII